MRYSLFIWRFRCHRRPAFVSSLLNSSKFLMFKVKCYCFVRTCPRTCIAAAFGGLSICTACFRMHEAYLLGRGGRSLRSMAVLSSRAQERRSHEKFTREARENERKSLPLQSPRGFSALARLYYQNRHATQAMICVSPIIHISLVICVSRVGIQ